MMKKQFLLYAIYAAFHLTASSQNVTPEVVASGGDFLANAAAQLSFTIGESAVIETFTAGNNILTQGFQQNELSNAGLSENKDKLSLYYWPNPSNGNLQLQLNPSQSGKLTLHVYDALGQHTGIIFVKEMNAGEYQETLYMEQLRTGFYFLDFTYQQSNGSTLKTSKKINIIQPY